MTVSGIEHKEVMSMTDKPEPKPLDAKEIREIFKSHKDAILKLNNDVKDLTEQTHKTIKEINQITVDINKMNMMAV